MSSAAKRILAVWKPQGPSVEVTVPVSASAIEKSERMPMAKGDPETVAWKAGEGISTKIEAGEAPVYLWLK